MRMRRVDGHLPWMSSWSECCYGYFDPLKPFNYLGKNRLIVNSDSLVDIIFVNNFRFHFPKLIILTMNTDELMRLPNYNFFCPHCSI